MSDFYAFFLSFLALISIFSLQTCIQGIASDTQMLAHHLDNMDTIHIELHTYDHQKLESHLPPNVNTVRLMKQL
ncbi:hypothetical protein BGX38DRAFT_1208428 [Terfezia claveryi]|nr:hypothetical protein BGX38DRAFT_1208428 [Terfezia claveryi]